MRREKTDHMKKVVAGMLMGTALYVPGVSQTSLAKSEEPAPALKRLPNGQPDIEGIWTTVYYGMGCLTNPTNGDVNCVPPPGPRPQEGTANAGGPPPTNAVDAKLGQRGHGNPPDIVEREQKKREEQQKLAAVEAASKPPTTGNPGATPRPGAGRGRGRIRNAPSRIIDTPDHDIPYTPVALAYQKDLFAHYYEPTRYGDIDPQQRCWPLGAVRQFTWHDVQFQQFPGYIVMIFEGAEQYRIIYLDGRPHIGSRLKLWFGDSRGHWEGNALVVETTNNNAKGRLSRAGDFSSSNVKYTERFEFLDANHLRYRAVFDDPSVYTRPWTFGFDEHRAYFGGDGGVPEGPVTAESQAKFEVWEEACQEGLIPGGNDIPGLPSTPPEKDVPEHLSRW